MKTYEITLIPGDGIGPEVTDVAKNIIDAMGISIKWDVVNAGQAVLEKTGKLVPEAVYESIEKNKVALKGPITTPIGSGFKSINVMLRKKYSLYANIRPVVSYKDDAIDLVIFRENTEGLYIGEERKVNEDHYEATKKVTRRASERIIEKAFEYAAENGFDKVTVVHKANILKLTDGLFLEVAREIKKSYEDIALEEVIIDNMCMQMVMNPSQFGVIVTMNLYGDILSDLAAGLVGGLGLIPGANIGSEFAVFEAVHGSAPDIAGKGLANPIAIVLSSAMMLEYIGEKKAADKIKHAIRNILREGKYLTRDLGGNLTTKEMEKAIKDELLRSSYDGK